MTAQLPSKVRLAQIASFSKSMALPPSHDEIEAMAAALLAAHEQEPVAWSVGGIATIDKKWAERRSAEDNLLMEPLYRHPIITGIDENHYDPELEPGLYVAEIMTKGGAAIINGYYTHPAPVPAVPDDVLTICQRLIKEYIANKGTSSEFICCVTPSRKTIGTGGVWDDWRALDKAVRAAMLNGGKS